ncbi:MULTISPECIES: SusC/RagA family TonB-linked outer membrane protein [Niastella]|uniref:SusC/RagA family TonB-linked outer membrane protein n=1 Tax=Niastella soli TaxID=2821487 RepID=A0ABS3YZQ6_9BACT|nr:SusC/RagA family TonB-linked outer membrane protein [Niastella soli]MBO9202992.1 SusC/RagA family TonB-linked outer membrane protein [Niastella soli]
MQKTADCGRSIPLATARKLAYAAFRVGKRERRHKFAQIMLVMRLTVLLLTAALVQVHATGLAQSVTLTGKAQTLKQVFAAIEKQTGYVVFSKKGTLAEMKPVTYDVQNMPLRDFLDVVLKGQPVQYVISGKTIMLTRKVMPPAPPTPVREEPVAAPAVVRLIINGQVTDSAGKPLSNASVSIKGKPSKGSAITDIQGRFRVSAEPGDVIVVTYVGYATATYKVKSDTESIVVSLKREVAVQEDIVITGIFNKPKESYTGATRVISEKEIKEFQGRNIFVTLGNIDPSFNVVTNNNIGSNPNTVPEIQLRGTRNLPNIDQFAAGGPTTQIARDQQFQYQSATLNAPLIIMDGFPITMQRMMDLNVNEIQNVTLLKDGSATALYGSQGANGVIVITTKQPQAGKLRLTYRGGANLSFPDLSSYHLLNARDKLALEKASGYYSIPTQGPDVNLKLEKYYNDILALVDGGQHTDWLRKPLRTQVDQNHSLRMEGGDASFRYALEGQYNLINGVMKDSKRETANGSVTISYRLNKVNFSNNLRIGSTKGNESPWGTFGDYAKLNPYWSPYDANGNIVQFFKPYLNEYWSQANPQYPYANPMYDATLNTFNKTSYTNIIENFQVDYRPVNHLALNGGISITSNQSTGDDFKPASHSKFSQDNSIDILRKGSYVYNSGKDFNFTGRLQALYNNTFAGVHNVSIGVSGDLNEVKSTNYTIAAEGFPDETIDFFGRALQYQAGGKPAGSEATTRRVGFVSSANYSYDDRYFVDLTYRVDGASQFGTDKRFAPFYAVGGGWNLHHERFLKDLPYLDRLKLRGSFGVTGNQAFSAYQPLATYSYIVTDRYKNWIGANQTNLGNPNLQWQQTDKMDLGLETQLFHDRVFIQFDYYKERTSNLLSSIELPYSNGFTDYVENIGTLEQKGYEVTARVTILRNNRNRMLWSITGNIAHNEDKIVKLSEALKAANEKLGLQYDYDTNLPNRIIREGASQNTIYVVPSLGIDPSTGKELYLTKTGEPSYTWNAVDRIAAGVSIPKYRGNFSTLFRYGGFTLNASFSYRFGGKIYNQTLIDKVENANRWFNVDERVFKDRWQKPGDHVAFRGLKETSEIYPSSRFVQNESAFTCQNVNLSYDVLNNKLLNKMRLKALNVSVNSGEVFYLSTVRQERGLDYPFTRQIGFYVYATF